MSMNKAIRRTATFALLLVLALLVNLTYVQAFTEDKYARNDYNRRPLIELKQIPRGQISTGGQILAESVQDADGLYSRRYVTDPIQYGPIEGYVSDIYGTSGLEKSFNAVLDGTDPELGGKSFMDRLTRSTTPGANLELTLNPAVQAVAYNELASRGYEGAVVAIRPKTGEILAMASTPSFDPAEIADNDTAEGAWKKLTNDPGAPLLNHATQETLPPGSTFKVITTAAGLEDGFGPGSPLTAAPEITLPGTTTTLENYAGMRCGEGDTATLLTAFTLSCNTAFVQMGIDVGAEKIKDVAQRFGVTESYDLGLPVDAGTLGDMADDASTGQSAIGQRDVAMTVLENAVIAATVANKGVRMKPYLVRSITRADLSTVKSFKPQDLGAAVDENIAAQLTDLMRASERHTAGYAGGDVASKTGTAEHGEDSRNSNPHAWYIAFGPTADADVAVAVVVKNGGDRGQAATGGSVAAPIGRAVINAALGQQ